MGYLCCRQDISSGHLPASFVSHVLLGALARNIELKFAKKLKAKLAKIGPLEVKNLLVPFAPIESHKLLAQISELHRSKKAKPAEQTKHRQSIVQYMELASKLQLFGVQCHIAKDHHNIDI